MTTTLFFTAIALILIALEYSYRRHTPSGQRMAGSSPSVDRDQARVACEVRTVRYH